MLLCSFFVICKVFWTPLFCSFFVFVFFFGHWWRCSVLSLFGCFWLYWCCFVPSLVGCFGHYWCCFVPQWCPIRLSTGSFTSGATLSTSMSKSTTTNHWNSPPSQSVTRTLSSKNCINALPISVSLYTFWPNHCLKKCHKYHGDCVSYSCITNWSVNVFKLSRLYFFQLDVHELYSTCSLFVIYRATASSTRNWYRMIETMYNGSSKSLSLADLEKFQASGLSFNQIFQQAAHRKEDLIVRYLR